jgi:hypothetical protein
MRALTARASKIHSVLRARSVNRFLTRHRRTTALLGAVIVLGVVGLNAHAALPEHHDEPGHVTMCAAALSIAILAAVALVTKCLPAPRKALRLVQRPRVKSRIAVRTASSNARAGPAVPVVLRR